MILHINHVQPGRSESTSGVVSTLLSLLEAGASSDDPSRVINIGSIDGPRTPAFDTVSYGPSKAAVHALTSQLAGKLVKRNILVNAIAPGPTALGIGMTDVGWARAIGFTPLKRESSADDISEMVVTLLRAETITGEVVRVDSGRHVVGSPLRDYDP